MASSFSRPVSADRGRIPEFAIKITLLKLEYRPNAAFVLEYL